MVFREKIKMVKNNILYSCEECGFKYKEKDIADKCEEWCKEHKSCNIAIAKYAIK